MGDAGQAVADLVGQGGDKVRLGPRQVFGLDQRPFAFARQPLAIGGQGELAAEVAVHQQGQQEGEGEGAPGQHGVLVRLGPAEQGREGAGHGRGRHDQQAGHGGRREEHADHRAGDGHHHDGLAGRSGAEAKRRDLSHRPGPEQTAQNLDPMPQRQILSLRPLEPVDDDVERAPVDGEDREAGGHQDAVESV